MGARYWICDCEAGNLWPAFEPACPRCKAARADGGIRTPTPVEIATALYANRTYLVSETYDIITKESSRDGDTSENGYLTQDIRCNGLADLIERETNCGWEREGDWFRGPADTDMQTGDTETRYLHVTRLDGTEIDGEELDLLVEGITI